MSTNRLLDIDMTYDSKDMRNIQNRLGSLGGRANTVMSQAANRAAAKANTVLKQQASKEFFVTQKRVASVTYIRRATTASPTASLMAKDTHDNLYKFKVTPAKIARPKGGGGKKPPKVYYSQVRKSGGRKALSRAPKPFVAQMKNGHIGLFQRKSDKSKAALKGLYGPAIPQLLKKKEIMDKVEEEATQVLLKRIDHEINRVLKGGMR